MKSFWGSFDNREAWLACRVDTQDPVVTFARLKNWIKDVHAHNATVQGCIPSDRMAIALMWPSAADFPRVNSYWSFMNTTPSGAAEMFLDYRCIDLRSYAMGKLGLPYAELGRKSVLHQYRDSYQNMHHALDDARNQGNWFFNLAYDRKPVVSLS